MKSFKSFTFDSFLAINPNKKVNSFDYLHTVYKAADLPEDFICLHSELYNPGLLVFENKIFLREQFSESEFKKHLQEGRTAAQAQFWINLLEITGIFDGLSIEQATRIGKGIVKFWNQKIQNEVSGDGLARFIHDKDTHEVFVVID